MKLDEIKDPKLRQRVEQALASALTFKKALRAEFAVCEPKKKRLVAINPHAETFSELLVKPKKRIRQHEGTGLNKNETEALEYLKEQYGSWDFRPHAIRLEIANGCHYTPDITMIRGSEIILYEVKGKHAWDDSIVKLKVVARQWRSFNFALIWKEEGRWMEQAIFP